jgi:hypothetical protein
MSNIDDLAAQQHASRTSRFAIRPADPLKMRPVEFVYEPWIVRGRGNEIVGEEDVGKSTFAVHIAARVTVGELPGVFEGKPRDVLFLGTDEDDWYGITLPRLLAASANLGRIHEFYALDENAMFNAEDHGSELGRLLAGHFGLVVIEHVLDILPPMRNPSEPAAIRRALRPMLRALAAQEIASLWTRHVNKAEARSFRQKAQGSMQFGAVARSSFLIAQHPTDLSRRVAVLGKANYVREKVSLSFAIAEHVFTANEQLFTVGRVVDVEEDETTMDEVLGGSESPRERRRGDLRGAVLGGFPVSTPLSNGNWKPPPVSAAEVAKSLGRTKGDGTVHRIVRELADADLIKEAEGGWVRPAPTNGGGDYDPELSPSLWSPEDAGS